MSHQFGRIAVALGMKGKLRFHDPRHTHATLSLQAGVHPKVVQERLGHTAIWTTLDTYSHVIPSMQKEVAAAFDAILRAHPTCLEQHMGTTQIAKTSLALGLFLERQ